MEHNSNQSNRKSENQDKEADEIYSRLGRDRTSLTKLSQMHFSSNLFKYWWSEYIGIRDFGVIKVMRRLIIYNTMWYLDQQKYICEDGTEVNLPLKDLLPEICKTEMFANNYHFKPVEKKFKTEINVVKGDCLEAAIKLVEMKLNPAVLDMASASNPGGGYLEGAGAQEENLCRRSNLFMYLHDPKRLDKQRKWRYPIPQFGGIYAPNVVVFRGTEADGYPLLVKPVKLGILADIKYILMRKGIIAVAAYAHPPLVMNKLLSNGNSIETKKERPKKKDFEENEDLRLSDEFADKTKKKMRAIFSIAMEKGHDSLVLSAFGCGNPPLHIAQLFQEVIKEFDGCFANITFAIFDDHNAKGKGNYAPFASVFGKLNSNQ